MNIGAGQHDSPQSLAVHGQMPAGVFGVRRVRHRDLVQNVQLWIQYADTGTAFSGGGEYAFVELRRQASAQCEVALRFEMDAIALSRPVRRFPLEQPRVDSGLPQPLCQQ